MTVLRGEVYKMKRRGPGWILEELHKEILRRYI